MADVAAVLPLRLFVAAITVLLSGLAPNAGAQRGIWVDYESPPPTLPAFASPTTAIILGRVVDSSQTYNTTLRELTVYRVAVLEIFKADAQLVAGTTVSVYVSGGPFSEDLVSGTELILFLSRNKDLRDGYFRDGYFIAFGPHGAYRMLDGRWAPFERSALGDAQRVKSAAAFLSDLRKLGTP